MKIFHNNFKVNSDFCCNVKEIQSSVVSATEIDMELL